MYFASGPTAKPQGWDVKKLARFSGRYHRSKKVSQALTQAHTRLKNLLQLPQGYELYFTPAGASGAFEAGLWNLLGNKVAVLDFDKFSHLWLKDCQKLAEHVECFSAPAGSIPPLDGIAPLRAKGFDVVFDEEWLTTKTPTDTLVFSDVTAAVFTHSIGWNNLDVAAFSWAKAMAGEAAHGALVLSPKAQSRLNQTRKLNQASNLNQTNNLNQKSNLNQTSRAVPHILTIPQRGDQPINTFSALAVADLLMALDWLEGIGGMTAAIEKAHANRLMLSQWSQKQNWLEELVKDNATNPSENIMINSMENSMANSPATYRFLGEPQRLEQMITQLETQYKIYDVKSHPYAPLGLRIWCGANVLPSQIERLTKALTASYNSTGKERKGKERQGTEKKGKEGNV